MLPNWSLLLVPRTQCFSSSYNFDYLYTPEFSMESKSGGKSRMSIQFLDQIRKKRVIIAPAFCSSLHKESAPCATLLLVCSSLPTNSCIFMFSNLPIKCMNFVVVSIR